MAEGSVVLPPMSSVEHFIMPTIETFLKTAAYFEDRARRTRQNDKRERLLAVALKYRERAAAVTKRDTAFAETANSRLSRSCSICKFTCCQISAGPASSSLACRPLPIIRPLGPIGSTRSSTMAIG